MSLCRYWNNDDMTVSGKGEGGEKPLKYGRYGRNRQTVKPSRQK